MIKPSRILTVDDNEIVSIKLSLALTAAGFQVCTTSSGRGALAALALQSFDLLIVDIQMPEMDGFALLQHLQTESRCSTTPALMLTASDDLFDVQKARSLGARGFLSKPFEDAELIRKSHRVLTCPDIAWIDDHHCLIHSVAAPSTERGRPAMMALQ